MEESLWKRSPEIVGPSLYMLILFLSEMFKSRDIDLNAPRK
jgi:hypothetical protein